ncbi:MAG TPA: cobalt-precorrin-6A reductase [Solirubrobacteraceae bacterium]
MTRPVLILGGTGEARAVAAALDLAAIPVVSALAGRVTRPRLPVGDVRIGGFGGPSGLSQWLIEHGIVAVVDATHPFAERISASATAATAAAGVPLLRLERPGWTARAGDRWHWVDDIPAAAAAIRRLGAARVFLTTGRQGLAEFAADRETWFLIRCVDPPSGELPPRRKVVLDRGPYTVAGELALLGRHRIDLLVTKDSGGPLTEAKLDAARARHLPVLIVRRPQRQPAGAVAVAQTVTEAAAWAIAQCRPEPRPTGLELSRPATASDA